MIALINVSNLLRWKFIDGKNINVMAGYNWTKIGTRINPVNNLHEHWFALQKNSKLYSKCFTSDDKAPHYSDEEMIDFIIHVKLKTESS